jgi:probable blue pigment (indigoidine) exporter
MLVVALGWGSCFPLLDWGVRGSSVLWFVTWRPVIAGLALLCGVAVRRRGRGDRVVSWSMWGLLAALAILNVTVGFAAMAATVTAVTAGVASVLGNAQAILAVAAAVIDGSPLNGLSTRFVSAVMLLALAGSALPYALWFGELRRASITAVTSWTLLVPVVGLVLGVLVLGESLTVWEIVGSALVVAAMALVATAGRAPCNRLRCRQHSGCALTECG